MKKANETTVTASFTGKISVAQWENVSPFFSLTEKFEGDLSDKEKAERQQKLYDICHKQFKQCAEVCNRERIKKEYQSIRFYGKFPSVTSVINWDADFHIPEDELAQYAARGTIIHKQAEVYHRTGVWEKPQDIPEIYPELVILKQGNLKLSVEDVNYLDFYKQYPFKVIDMEKVLINEKFKYGGRRDIKCIIDSKNPGKWNKVEGVIFDVPTILDIKTGTVEKLKCMKQLTAYWHCEDDVQQVGIIPLTNSTQQGFSKPTVCTNKEKYWTLFFNDRKRFKKRYGV